MLKTISRASCLLFLACFVVVAATSAVLAGQDGSQAQVVMAETSTNVVPLASHTDATTYFFSIGPGETYENYSELDGEWLGTCGAVADFDRYVMTVTETTVVTVEVIDCCEEGDNICLARDPKRGLCALSPETVVFTSDPLIPGEYVFYVAYHGETNCIFPAGYDVFVSAEPVSAE